MKKFIEALANIIESNTPEARRLAARLEESPEKSAELVAHHIGSATQPIRLPEAPSTTRGKYLISKHSVETGWLFVKEFEGTYNEAIEEVGKLQFLDTGFSYRIWDDRKEIPEEKHLNWSDEGAQSLNWGNNSLDEEFRRNCGQPQGNNSQSMKVVLIAAIGKNRELGHKGQIPWRLPNDLKHFKKTTEGHVVVMGRKTYESIPERYRPLPGRINVVLSRTAGKEDYPGCLVFNALHEVINHFARDGEDIIFVAGGGEVYEEAICYSKEMIITEVDGEFEADTFFPWISDAWRGRTVETFPKNEVNQYKFSIRRYENRLLKGVNLIEWLAGSTVAGQQRT